MVERLIAAVTLPALLWKWYYSCKRCLVSSLAPIQELVRDSRFSSKASIIFSNISVEIGFANRDIYGSMGCPLDHIR
jgi:hypothetical protein